jgi:protein NrfC
MKDDDPTSYLAVSRRRFLAVAGSAAALLAAGADVLFADGRLVIPNAEGFLVVDMKKCQGCSTCMMACALAHAGKASYNLARIQIQQDPWVNWPDDVHMATCRQCENAPCVDACPVEPIKANKPNPDRGNVRMIDPALCIGCQSCLSACPWTPFRLQWNSATGTSQKCDLCVDTPFLGERGGPGGMQTCVRVCPVNAIAFTAKMPDQGVESSYFVNLRGPAWRRLGMTSK